LKKPFFTEERKKQRFGFGPCNEDKMADDKNRVPLFDGRNFSNWNEKDLLELVTELYSAKVVIQKGDKEQMKKEKRDRLVELRKNDKKGKSKKSKSKKRQMKKKGLKMTLKLKRLLKKKPTSVNAAVVREGLLSS
jgi:hypothetical protein